VSRAGLLERLQSSGAVLLTQLSRVDLPHPEDRALFDQIQLGLLGLHLASGGRATAGEAPGDEALEAIASEILDLRDTIMGRAIREAAHRDDEPLDWPDGLN
jgi:hypothetical protein